VDGGRQLHRLLRTPRKQDLARSTKREIHRLDQDPQDRGREQTRLLVGNFSGRSSGEPTQILGNALPQVPKNSDTPTVVIRRILLISSRLSLYLPLHLPFSHLKSAACEKMQRKALPIVC
jgi:hypothetical protein